MLLSLAIPIQATAAALAVPPPCVMDPSPAQLHGSDAHHAAPCCNDAETAAKTGKLCKSGHDCKSLGLALGMPHRMLPIGSPRGAEPLHLPIPRLDATRARIWRPPSMHLMT